MSDSKGFAMRRADERSAPPPDIEPITVRVAMAVKLTGASRSRIYELIESGDLETKKVGRSTFILFKSLKRVFGS
jgi:hypothetical protein